MLAPRSQVWTACIWTAVMVRSAWAQTVRYAELNSSVTLELECVSSSCQAALWFWQPRRRPHEFHFLFYHNTVDRVSYGRGVDRAKYKWGRRSGARPTFALIIADVRESDAGRYFCQFPETRSLTRIPGIELRPGENPPAPPTTSPPPKTSPTCRCRNQGTDRSPKGCGPLVLWPLVGVLISLAVVLIATLFYFSRLPKKCRHRFVKKRQLQ